MKKQFPCPVCRRMVQVIFVIDGSEILRHPKDSRCTIDKSDLLKAYVHACQPEPKFPKIDGHELINDKGGIDFGKS